ncbi:hypothetical protein [Kitasatospora mediocidica]|uniref:hypothetical protein n=1 Tax=Kitasatospora mediocidica TaxID=58352 RepID=UPI0007C7D6CE|nr:hypothetical protein [Kitasatospora mediocidica]
MTSGTRTVTVFLTVISGLLLAAIDVTAHWPLWTWSVLAALLLAVPALSIRLAGRRTNPLPLDMVPHLTMAPVERLEQRVARVALPSGRDDYDFVFSATVRWSVTGAASDEPIVNPGGLAVDAVLERARAITEKRDPVRASLVQHELNGVLGLMRPDATGYLQAMAEAVTLTLSDRDHERLEKLAAVRKDKAVWEHERTYERSRREYLGEDVLKDTGSAVVWWLARNEDRVDKTVEDLGLLAQLSSAANNMDVPAQYRHMVPQPVPAPLFVPDYPSADPSSVYEPSAADHVDAFLRTMDLAPDDPERALLAHRIAGIVAAHGRREVADELLERFDVPGARQPGEEPAEGDSEDQGEGEVVRE